MGTTITDETGAEQLGAEQLGAEQTGAEQTGAEQTAGEHAAGERASDEAGGGSAVDAAAGSTDAFVAVTSMERDPETLFAGDRGVLDQAVRAAAAGGRGPCGPRSVDGPGLEYVEQPCASVEELVELRSRLAVGGVRVDVAADESIRRAEDPLRVVRAGGADRAVVKAAPLGGPRRLLQVAGELGVPVTVSSALDSAVGMAAGLAAAAALPDRPDGSPPAAAGLGTGGFFIEDVVDPRHGPALVDGVIAVRTVVPDPDRLAGLAVEAARRDWWLERLRRCHALL